MCKEWGGPGELPFHGSRKLAEAQADVRAPWRCKSCWAGVGSLGQNTPRRARPLPRDGGGWTKGDTHTFTCRPAATGGPHRHTDLTQTQTQIYLAVSPCTQRQAHAHTCAPTRACVPGHMQQDEDTHTHTCTYGCTSSWAHWDAHGQQGPGEPVADDSCSGSSR